MSEFFLTLSKVVIYMSNVCSVASQVGKDSCWSYSNLFMVGFAFL